ncbi:uncharacterized protein LOC142349685 [Convolutriloba macropyga]|uniref:uncharacterized protein LOC142349685 n=1 Tax=Convolutriloba macropyga TaxID=536237 RepID=UPI003F528836
MAVRKNESKRNVSKKSSVSSSVKINQSTSGDEELPVIPDVIASSRRSGNFTKILILLIVCVLVVNQVFIFKMWRNRGVENPDLLKLMSEDAYPDEQVLVDGDDGSCYDAAELDAGNLVFILLTKGIANINYIDMLLPANATRGIVMEVFACIEDLCWSNCENIELSEVVYFVHAHWRRSICSSPGEYIKIEQKSGYLNLCEVKVYGKMLN